MLSGSTPRGVLRLAAYFGVTLLGMPFQALLIILRSGLVRHLPVLYHRISCRILGLDVQVVGTPVRRGPALMISNHSSYLDIPVLASVLPASFVAKAEVARWPFFSWLAKLQRTVFVDRNSRRDSRRQADSIGDRLAGGDMLILFPEGTSSDGNRTLPFKSALFAAAATRIGDQPVTVQPVSVTATHLDGLPLGHGMRALYAWYGDMELPTHLWAMVRSGTLRVVVEFHPPITIDDFPSRKALADHCWGQVAAGVDRAVRGQLPAKKSLSVTAPVTAPDTAADALPVA